ncbi:MAG: hypothetical protein GX046_07155 [Tissierellia bacterium]|nr:hypothetical protein [Tissierellia bacterium]
MKVLRLAGLVLLVMILQLPIVRNEKKVPEIRSYHGTFIEVYEDLEKEFGPWSDKLVLEDGAWLQRGKDSFEILRDNYKGADFLVFINK